MKGEDWFKYGVLVFVAAVFILLVALSGCIDVYEEKIGMVVKIEKDWDVGFTYSDTADFVYFDDGKVFDVRGGDVDNIRLNVTGKYRFEQHKYNNEIFYDFVDVKYDDET